MRSDLKMGVKNRKKLAGRAGGLAAALAVAGAIGLGGASGAMASGPTTPNEPIGSGGMTTEPNGPLTQEEIDAWRTIAGCGVVAITGLPKGPPGYIIAYGACYGGQAILP